MKEFEWSGYKWIPQERWGLIHPDKSHWWYDSSQIEITDSGSLLLKTDYNPRYFDELNVTSNIGVGLVSCLTEFSYGTFEIEAKLPFGNNLWPAFWMYSWYSWPPEIDILEGYSDRSPRYINRRSFLNLFGATYDIETNLHYTDNGVKKEIYGNKNRLRVDPTRNFINYSCEWDKNYIRFYYDDVLVREITDRNILSKFDGHSMNVLINNGVTSFVDKNNPPKSVFEIKKFSYKKANRPSQLNDLP